MKTKRLFSGMYLINDRFEVERMIGFDGEVMWNITEKGEWHETLSTLRECKVWIRERFSN